MGQATGQVLTFAVGVSLSPIPIIAVVLVLATPKGRILGVLLMLVAARQWRGRPKGDAEPELPAWMNSIDTFTPPKATVRSSCNIIEP